MPNPQQHRLLRQGRTEDTAAIEAREKQIRRLHAQGLSAIEIGSAVSLSKAYVHQLLKSYGVLDGFVQCPDCKQFKNANEFARGSQACKLCRAKENSQKKRQMHLDIEFDNKKRRGIPGNFVKRTRRTKTRKIEDIIEPASLRKKVPLSDSRPDVAAFWYYKRNCGYGPEDFSAGSSIAAWWFCDEGPDHIFQQRICQKVKTHKQQTKVLGCPYCDGKLASVTNCLANYPKLAREWMTARNGCTAKEIVYGSKRKGWWQCFKCGHQWEATPANRARNESGCSGPACLGKLGLDLRLFPVALRQFDKQRNPGADPYALKVKEKYYWKCDVARDHRWRSSFTRTAGERCPFCRGDLPSSTNNLTLRPDLAKQYHPRKNGKLKASQVTLQCRKSVWWLCKVAEDHEWQAAPKSRTRDGHGCPFCTNLYVSASNCLATVAPDVARQWHPKKNGTRTPHNVKAGARFKAWWLCERGHSYEMVVRSRVEKGGGCDECRKAARLEAKRCLRCDVLKNPCEFEIGRNVCQVCRRGRRPR